MINLSAEDVKSICEKAEEKLFDCTSFELENFDEYFQLPIRVECSEEIDFCLDDLYEAMQKKKETYNKKHKTNIEMNCKCFSPTDDIDFIFGEDCVGPDIVRIFVGNELVFCSKEDPSCYDEYELSDYYRRIADSLKDILNEYNDRIIEIQNANNAKLEFFESEGYDEIVYEYYKRIGYKDKMLHYAKRLAERYPNSRYKRTLRRLYANKVAKGNKNLSGIHRKMFNERHGIDNF